jgi:hypothetical protein
VRKRRRTASAGFKLVGTAFDLHTGRASSLQIQVAADVKLEDPHSKKVVYANPTFVFRQEYQVSQTTSGLFQEGQAALDRLSRDVARTLVTEILENFWVLHRFRRLHR